MADMSDKAVDEIAAFAKERARSHFVAGWNECEASMGVWIDAEAAFEQYWEKMDG